MRSTTAPSRARQPSPPSVRWPTSSLPFLSAPSKRFKVVGLGETARFIDGQITGGALVFDGRLIHVMAFSAECAKPHQAEHSKAKG